MLIPMWMPAQGPPSPLQLKMRPVLCTIVWLQGIVAVCRFVAMDIWGGLSDSMVVVIGYFAATEAVIMYNMWYGMACACNAFFDMVAVTLRLIKWKGDYFKIELGFFFNLLSFSLVAATAVALTGAMVNYLIWKDFQRNAMEGMPLIPPAQSTFAAPPRPGGSGENTGGYSAFAGQGHRLGSKDTGSPGERESPAMAAQRRREAVRESPVFQDEVPAPAAAQQPREASGEAARVVDV
eukprot:gnl/TRDRNA2_/TRDRNA2_37956_c0_seq1.p1 gnl/TRDRNA2_/TRDRNA2_37956_c0~~gnl/TRDRNA2_/TRDRNA2_37956_c0_seq1.p1  ORF type:complete len:237 (-),score=45.32 gnl/TRDRNA2_/TRDRNA2_37956_c0_seq1:12-722(-)